MVETIVMDVDGTIVDNSIGESIGAEAYRQSEGWKKTYGLLKGLQIKMGTPLFGEKWGLENFVEALSVAGVTKQQAELYCKIGLEKHTIPAAKDFLPSGCLFQR